MADARQTVSRMIYQSLGWGIYLSLSLLEPLRLLVWVLPSKMRLHT